MLIATGDPRYAAVRTLGVYVIWDGALGDFCTLPDLQGEPQLLTFDRAHQVLRWLMRCQERGLDLGMPKGREHLPAPEPVV